MTPRRAAAGAALAILAAWTGGAAAYPEFQRAVVEASRRPVDCALCHTHPDGPEGTAPGQIGRLSPAELDELGRARAAFDPGNDATSPVLNAFGVHLLNALGRRRLMELRLVPGQLADAVPAGVDLDADGIENRIELAEGTHPLNDADGRPDRLFRHNLVRQRVPLLLTLAATILGLYGLRHLLAGFAIEARGGDGEEREDHR
jgi:hypothetical protein